MGRRFVGGGEDLLVPPEAPRNGSINNSHDYIINNNNNNNVNNNKFVGGGGGGWGNSGSVFSGAAIDGGSRKGNEALQRMAEQWTERGNPSSTPYMASPFRTAVPFWGQNT